MSSIEERSSYEPPRLEVLGKVEVLTQVTDKKYGEADGFTFMGTSITNAS
ncbi:MAG TPA: lasso RiPP family leader peptide-containing protein [Baekduia sp.]|nr:lasso RiPP family leader peptide-containing protein [Baekduia sp.]